MWLGFCTVELFKSPKFQDQAVGVLVEVSVKDTARGGAPMVGVPEKFATGGLPPLGTTHSLKRTMSKAMLQAGCDTVQPETVSVAHTSRPRWPLPSQDIQFAGEVVVQDQ